MTVNLRGYIFDDTGTGFSSASVKLLETGTTSQVGSTFTTSSDGLWYFSGVDDSTYDIQITAGSSVRNIKWNDQISLKELDVRNNTGNTTPAATFTNLTNNAANQVAVFSGANTTRADNDEIYMSFKLADSGGNIDEFARMTIVATDVTAGSEDGQIEFDVMKAGTLTKVWTITSSSGAAMSFDMNVDALTIGSGADTDVSLTFDANSADGVITWMEDEDYFKFSDDILMNSTERINFYDTAIYIYSSTDGQLDLVADTEIQIAATTVDLNGNLDVSGTYTGAGLMTTGGNIVIPNAGNIGSASDTDAIAISSGGVVTMNQIPVFSAGINVSGGTIAGTIATATQNSITTMTGLVTTGALASGTIASGFGTISTGNTITTTAKITGGELDIDDVIINGATIGHTDDTDLITLADGIATVAGEISVTTLDIGGTNVSATASEINLIDGGTARGTTAIADGDGVLINDDGTMRMTTVQTLAAYLDDEITAMPNLVTTGTIGTGVWEGTDVAVSHGGTGASSLTDGGILLGSGTSAITAMAVLADGEMIVGDGTTDPVAESGATLRTSIGVGTGNNVEFAAITGTTIDATTDFTIGDTVVTNGVITDSSGLALAANVTVTGNVLPNADDTYDLGSASAAWQDLFLEGDITLTDAGTIATSAGILTIDGDDGILLTQGGSGGLDIAGYAAVGSGEGGAGLFSKHTFIIDRNHTVSAGGSQLFVKGDMTIDGGTNEYAQIYAGSDSGYNTSFVINSGGVHPYISTAAFYEPNITETSGSVTNAVVMQLVDAPTEGTNNYSLWCRQVSGRANYARFDSGVIIGNTTSTNSLIDDSTTGSGTVTLYIGTNTIDVTDPSDSILKENIEDTSIDSLSILDQLRLRDFNWKSDNENYGHRTERQFGMVAQEVEEVLPHLVRQDDDGIRNVQYNRMIPYLVKAIQELNQELQEIKGGS
jgi:hypothetical protein